jgi:hypothetical protein
MNEEYVRIGIYVSVAVILLTKSDSFLNNWAKLFLIVMIGYCLAQGVINLP